MDDIFESSVNLEQHHIQQGYTEGFKEGEQLGKIEGRDVGLKSGFEVGEELGFYRGCINVWKVALEIEPTLFSARVQKNIKQLEELLDKYPLLDPENESVQDILEAMRTKFRAISATLSVHLEYDGYPKRDYVSVEASEVIDHGEIVICSKAGAIIYSVLVSIQLCWNCRNKNHGNAGILVSRLSTFF